MVPAWVPGSPRVWNLATTVAEAGAAGLLVRWRTSHLGGWVAAGTFGVVGVANVQAVVDGGMSALPGRLSTRWAAVVRLPLQLPLIWWAWQVARRPDRRVTLAPECAPTAHPGGRAGVPSARRTVVATPTVGAPQRHPWSTP